MKLETRHVPLSLVTRTLRAMKLVMEISGRDREACTKDEVLAALAEMKRCQAALEAVARGEEPTP